MQRYFFITPTLIFLLMAGTLLAQNPLPRMSIVLNSHTPTDFKQTVYDLNEAEGIKVIYRQDPVIRFTYESENDRVAAMQELYNRSFHVSTKSGVPIDYPMLQTNPTQDDIDAFEQQKAEWIEANPQRYEEMQQSDGIIVISQEEFDQMSPEKQQNILDNPELYTIE